MKIKLDNILDLAQLQRRRKIERANQAFIVARWNLSNQKLEP